MIFTHNCDDDSNDNDHEDDDDDDEMRPLQADVTEPAEDLRRWESETQFLFFSGPCKPDVKFVRNSEVLRIDCWIIAMEDHLSDPP